MFIFLYATDIHQEAARYLTSSTTISAEQYEKDKQKSLTLYEAFKKGHKESFDTLIAEETQPCLPEFQSPESWKAFQEALAQQDNLKFFETLHEISNFNNSREVLEFGLRAYLYQTQENLTSLVDIQKKAQELQIQIKKQLQDTLFYQQWISAYTFQQIITPLGLFIIASILGFSSIFESSHQMGLMIASSVFTGIAVI
ncbi:MAG: hypothetical protein H6850_02720 [Alphaproteobacteria bacterium]|nr:MAG: hypothetical protein H6850_02720 [Alphaproteobacteria bacterium]